VCLGMSPCCSILLMRTRTLLLMLSTFVRMLMLMLMPSTFVVMLVLQSTLLLRSSTSPCRTTVPIRMRTAFPALWL